MSTERESLVKAKKREVGFLVSDAAIAVMSSSVLNLWIDLVVRANPDGQLPKRIAIIPASIGLVAMVKGLTHLINALDYADRMDNAE